MGPLRGGLSGLSWYAGDTYPPWSVAGPLALALGAATCPQLRVRLPVVESPAAALHSHQNGARGFFSGAISFMVADS